MIIEEKGRISDVNAARLMLIPISRFKQVRLGSSEIFSCLSDVFIHFTISDIVV